MQQSRRGTKYEELAGRIREDIVSGKLCEDRKLPPRREFQSEYGVSSITVQKAFDLLREEGFIESRGKTGTYLAPYPPHSHRVGIVYHHPRKHIRRSKFYSRILEQAEKVAVETPYEFEQYYQVGREGSVGQRETQRLFGDMRDHRLGGVLIGHNVPAFPFPEWPVWKETEMPRIVVQSSPIHPEFPAIYPVMQGFYGMALDGFLDRGIRRIGVVGSARVANEAKPLLDVELNKRGLSIPAYLRLPISPHDGTAVKNAVDMMMRLENCPGGLLVTDDNLLDHVGAGILAAGLRVPEDILVISDANFPVPEGSIIPAIHVGFDIHQMVMRCLKCMEQQRLRGVFHDRTILLEPEVAESSDTFFQEDGSYETEGIYSD